MKRWIFGLVLAFALALAGGFPASPRFDRPVTVKTSAAGDPLEAVLAALAKSVGLTPVIKLPEELAKTKIRLDIEQKPFRKVWDVVLKTFGDEKIDFALLDDDLLLVAPPEVVARAQGQGKAPEKPQKPAVVRAFLTVKYIDPDQAIKLLKTELPQLSVVRVPNQRVLIVRGTPELIDEVKRLLAKIDVAPEVEQAKTEKAPIVRRFYAVRYLDPTKLAAFLSQEVPGIKVAQVPGQKVLIVRGTEAQQKEVQAILAKVDVAPEAGPPIYQRTFRLSNAKAEDLAKVLQGALQAKGVAATKGQPGQAGQPAPGGANPTVSIVADPRTNTLIVTGTAEQLQLVEELIPKLDRPVEQVNVQVRIQEVTRSTLNNLGLKWQAAGGNLVAALADAGLSLIFDATRSLAALNISATLNALEKQGLSKRVNDSNITVLNNQKGRIQSGFTFFIRRVVDNKVEKVPYDAGVIVEVTPQVTNSGEIVLKIHTEVSDILERNPVDGDVDKLSKQVSDTILRVKDGQTVVLGGLIKNSTKHSKQGIPLLSDIPLIGALFSQTSDESEDNELIIVLKARRTTPTTCPGTLAVPCGG